MTGKPLDYQALETLNLVRKEERDEARAIVVDLARTLRKTLWHELGCASMCADDADCDCNAKPMKGDEFTMHALLAAEQVIERWELGFEATDRASAADA